MKFQFYSLLFLFFGLKVSAFSQSCYYVLADLMKVTTSFSETQVESNACSLIASLPSEIQTSFKVIVIGDYRFWSDYKQGVESWRQLIPSLALDNSDYYLLLFRGMNSTGQVLPCKAILKLPTTGIFNCLTSNNVSAIERRIESKMDATFKNPSSFREAEFEGINELKKIVEEIKNGNCCTTDPEIIKKELESLGFIGIPCKIRSTSTIIAPNLRNAVSVYDFANVSIELDNEIFELNSKVGEIVNGQQSQGLNSIGYITDNNSFCNPNEFNFVRTEFQQDLEDGDIWMHIWTNTEKTEDILYLKVEQFKIKIHSLDLYTQHTLINLKNKGNYPEEYLAKFETLIRSDFETDKHEIYFCLDNLALGTTYDNTNGLQFVQKELSSDYLFDKNFGLPGSKSGFILTKVLAFINNTVNFFTYKYPWPPTEPFNTPAALFRNSVSDFIKKSVPFDIKPKEFLDFTGSVLKNINNEFANGATWRIGWKEGWMFSKPATVRILRLHPTSFENKALNLEIKSRPVADIKISIFYW